MIDYTIFYKRELPVDGAWPAGNEWDVFLSAYTDAERVRQLFEKVNAASKHWLLFPEYNYGKDDSFPTSAFHCAARNEAEFIQEFWGAFPHDIAEKKICVDTTGFIRPYLMFLLRWFVQKGIRRIDALYTEPVRYSDGAKTSFSDEAVTEVRQVIGYEGEHVTDTSKDVLIIGAGYDDKLIAEVAEHKDEARKIQIFGLPSLRADMYQENVLRAHRAEAAVGGADPRRFKHILRAGERPFRNCSSVARDCQRSEIARSDHKSVPKSACYEGPGLGVCPILSHGVSWSAGQLAIPVL